MYAINVEGTKNVMHAAAAHGAKVVFVSTSGTVGVSRDPSRAATDSSPYASDVIRGWPYYDSKRRAEEAANAIAEALGVRLVVVRPSSILGPGPADPTLQTAKALAYYAHKGLYKHLCRRVPFIPAGGINFCDVRDVAQVATPLLLTHANDVCVCARARATFEMSGRRRDLLIHLLICYCPHKRQQTPR